MRCHYALMTAVQAEATAAGSWAAALQQADAVFHVLHGHEQHVCQTVLELAQQAVSMKAGVTTMLECWDHRLRQAAPVHHTLNLHRC